MNNQVTEVRGGRIKVRTAIVVPVVVAVVVAVAVLMCVKPEPRYQGKRLSWWCEIINTNVPLNEEAIRAVREIGTNAIPWLLADLKAEDSLFFAQANRFLGEIRFVKWRFPNPDYRGHRGCWGLFALGELATNAIPELEAMGTWRSGKASLAMSGMGHAAVPALCRMLTNGNQYIEANAATHITLATQLGRMSTNDLAVYVPILLERESNGTHHVQTRISGLLEMLRQSGSIPGAASESGAK